ncbi:MAG: biotin--[acetyl-CoA-carboxylase] ligase [Prolixibacteraceae bacterium]|jgi:BirA family biotin operon repressor/biotin-[acetyl-CoA-carboxylase] ligase|nr:biotin--[acetyl-CoA-carboxylase] ligase [Prolixibacteraceae bacterium]
MADIIGKHTIKLESVDSTNNYATAHMTNNNWKEGTVVLAKNQKKGRGQINNSWESEPGKNLLMSVVLYPEFLPVQNQFILSKVVTLALCEVVSLYASNVFVKWPNDIYVGNQKVAGVLIENAIMGATLYSSVIGIGLNVNQLKFESDAPNPVSLCQLIHKEINLDDLQVQLNESIGKWYLKLKNNEIDLINASFENKLFRIGEVSDYEDSSGVFSGVIMGVSEIGQLKIMTTNGVLKLFHFKEVAFII